MKDIENKMTNFITNIIDKDLKDNKHSGKVITRFPPEPNGYIHIGHAKSICLNFGLALQYNGTCNLRFDDTNPTKENTEFVESIKNDVKWLGFDYGDNLYFASDYFDMMYNYAVELIKKGKAYVCDLSFEESKEHKGTLTVAGKNSPYRDRSMEENLNLFEKMKNGEFAEGSCVLRAKIDMSSSNVNMRDPVMYRIQKAYHHNTKDKWCIYPMYDWAHGIEDYIEKITHSICTLEFEDHRPLYDWFLDNLSLDHYHPQQIEFAMLNITKTVLSKRRLKKLVDDKFVDSWDDPRMPTVSGMRRRGYPAAAIRNFANAIGVSKSNSLVEYEYLEFFIRNELDEIASRAMVILDPIKLVITNYPENEEEWFDAKNHPKKDEMGTRKIPFSREIYIERDDFMENPSSKFFRLAPGTEVRLQHAYHITCDNLVKDENGNIIEIQCSYDPTTKGGWVPGRKVKGTLHWVSAKHAVKATANIYSQILTVDSLNDIPEDKEFTDYFNKDSLIKKECFIEPSISDSEPLSYFQFLRNGYFCTDKLSTKEHPIFNLTVSLKESKDK